MSVGLHEIAEVALETIPEPIVIVDKVGKILAANAAFLDTIRSDSKPFIGHNVITHLTVADTKIGSPQLIDNWQGPATWQGGEGNAVTLYVIVRRLKSATDEELGFILLFRNIYEARKREDYRRALHQEKLEALGMYAGSIAHDLNNVLTSILGHVSFFKINGGRDPKTSEALNAIEDGTRRAARMTKQILEYARGAESEFSPVSFRAVVHDSINLIRGLINGENELKFFDSAKDHFVFGDQGQLGRLVVNLAVNARDALSGRGKIEISLSDELIKDEAKAKKLGLPCGSYVKLSVSDNGVGIPVSVRERIFEPFFTTKATHGTGLGLATVKAIASAHHGAICFESAEGQGTTFDVYLPQRDSGEGQTESKPESAALPIGREKILVVDDEESVRTIIQRSLQHLGYEVEVAQNGLEAMQLFSKGKYQLVIIDMIMPQMSGDELYFKLRGIDEKVAVLIASGYSSDKRTRAVLQAGGRGFIQKPFAIEELAQEVRKCLDLT